MKKITPMLNNFKEKCSTLFQKISLWWDTQHPLPYKELDTLETKEKETKNLSVGKQAVIFR